MTRHLADPVAAARAVVGWYGDPTVSWSVLLEASLDQPVPATVVGQRLQALIGQFPHLGTPPPVLARASADWAAVRTAFADEPYRDNEPLVRAAVGTDHGQLLLAAHHGATDGLGLLAILGAALDEPAVSQARGIADRPSASAFLSSAARRLAEALFAPPARVAPAPFAPPARPTDPPARATDPPARAADPPAGPPGDRTGDRTGDVLAAAELPAVSAGSAPLTAAVTRAAQEWNTHHGAPYRRAVAGLGVSRRDGHQATPVADSAFLRLRLPRDASPALVRQLIAAQPPEPDFPRSRSAAPALLTRVLASRLGSTFLVSNLGAVRAGPGVRALAFYPAASGRSGIAVGAATAGAVTTVTLRARRAAFDPAAAQALLERVTTHLVALTHRP